MAEILTLVLVSLLAVAAPPLLGRTRLPLVVGELGLGLAAGAATVLAEPVLGVPLLVQGELVDLLATLGVIILFFLIGLELDFTLMEAHGPRPVLEGATMLVLSLGIAYAGVELLLDLPFAAAVFLALILAETSVAVLYPALRDAGIESEASGQALLVHGLVAEFGVVILITVVSLAYEPGAGLTLDTPAPLLALPLLGVVLYGVYRVGGWAMWNHPEFLNRFFVRDDPAEMGVRVSLALVFILAALSETLGAEAILGSLFAGMIVSLLFRETGFLERKLFGLGYGFLIPIFFIHAGLSFDWTVLSDPASLLLVPTLLVVVLAAKLLPAAVLVPTWGLRGAASAGALLASRLTLSVAVASIGLELGLIRRDLYSAVLLLAVLMAVAAPALFNALRAKEVDLA